MHAVSWGRVDTVKMLVEHGADINCKTDFLEVISDVIDVAFHCSFVGEEKTFKFIEYIISLPELKQTVLLFTVTHSIKDEG